MEYNVPLGICRTRNVKPPAYGSAGAGCIDFFVPIFDEPFIDALAKKNPRLSSDEIEYIKKTKAIVLLPNEDICIPSGIHAKLEPHTALTAFNKSGVATKLNLIRGAEYVDCDYTGEIHLHMINVGSYEVPIEEGMKLVQFSYVPVLTAEIKQFDTKDALYDGFSSIRGENWQGSTGMK